MAHYVAVKSHPATNTTGRRISVEIEGTHSRRYYPWNHALDAGDNLREAAYTYCREVLAKAGHLIDTPVLTEYQDNKTGLPVGFGWE